MKSSITQQKAVSSAWRLEIVASAEVVVRAAGWLRGAGDYVQAVA
jgi:hypothetical protein